MSHMLHVHVHVTNFFSLVLSVFVALCEMQGQVRDGWSETKRKISYTCDFAVIQQMYMYMRTVVCYVSE